MIGTNRRAARFILLIGMIVLLSASAVEAQLPYPKLQRYFKIFGSLSLPVGDFASTTGAKAGYAKVGFSGGGEFDAEVIQSFELGLMASLTLHEFDAAEVQRQIRQQYSDGEVQAGNWMLIHIMGHAGFSIPASPAVTVYGKLYLGAAVGTIPDIRIYIGGVQAKQSSATSTTLSYGLGTGMMVTNSFDIGMRYLTAEPEYQLTAVAGQISGNQTVSQSTVYKQPSGVIQLSVGYIFH